MQQITDTTWKNYRQCKCGTAMSKGCGVGDDGKWWCSECGRMLHEFVCTDPIWYEPKILSTTWNDIVRNINLE